MQSKSLLLAIAAFAVTTTSASAFNSNVLANADLTEQQISALEVARELRAEGDKDAARDVLVEAGIDEEVLRSLKAAIREARTEKREEIRAAIEATDYDAFVSATAELERFDVIESESDFKLLVEAYSLRAAGEREAARAIMEDLGLERPERSHRGFRSALREQLTDDQREALRVARQGNDRETVRAILEEAGIERR